jgi:hypothetical protein
MQLVELYQILAIGSTILPGRVSASFSFRQELEVGHSQQVKAKPSRPRLLYELGIFSKKTLATLNGLKAVPIA